MADKSGTRYRAKLDTVTTDKELWEMAKRRQLKRKKVLKLPPMSLYSNAELLKS